MNACVKKCSSVESPPERRNPRRHALAALDKRDAPFVVAKTKTGQRFKRPRDCADP
jgi:hypothetical protein